MHQMCVLLEGYWWSGFIVEVSQKDNVGEVSISFLSLWEELQPAPT